MNRALAIVLLVVGLAFLGQPTLYEDGSLSIAGASVCLPTGVCTEESA